MDKKFLTRALVWGMALWAFGYLLGIVLFFVVPAELIGWVIMPLGIAVTLRVLAKKFEGMDLKRYLALGIVWALSAIALDYFLLVQVFRPADGYYKPDVYLYYALTFLLPPAYYFRTRGKSST